MAADVAGLIRALGERRAVLVGSGYGAMVAWATACFHPNLVRSLVVIAAAHPLRLRAGLATDPRGQLAASAALLRFQVPRYEHVLTRNGAAAIGSFLRRWSGPDWQAQPDFIAYEMLCREAFCIPQVSFCALEAYRWAVRSVLRLQGYRFVKQLQQPIMAPTLHLHGAADTAVLPRTAQGSGRYVRSEYEWRLLDGVGHFPHREASDHVTGEILRWAKEAGG
jgi:pimeloyl-ACP methyl ester carboxylesterase